MNDMTAVAPDAGAIQLEDSERQRCEVWTRVMGYHRPVASFNIGKQGEFRERRFFEERVTGVDG
jgi:anaerobic ribonucleoside-triphosphate reductase